MKYVKEIIPYVVIILVIILLRTFIITPVQVDGPSMDDTLNNGELLLLSKISYITKEIERFDIVVINTGDSEIIKRVIGLPGEEVEYKDNVLYINGEEIEDDYASNETSDFTIKDICNAGLRKDAIVSDQDVEKECTYTTIPEGYYLVLGDNRKISADSRYYGLIKEEDIVGKTIFRIWPLDKFGQIK